MAKLNIPIQSIPTVEDAYNSLIGSKDNTIFNLPLSSLDIIEEQPFPINNEKIEQIAESIGSVGVIEPLIVRKKDGGRYDILSGRHRYKACQKLNMKEIPCFIKSDLSDDMARFILIATNTDRNNEYPPSVYAKAYKEQMELYKKLGKKLKDIADEQGTNRKQIYRYLRLNSLIPEFLDMVDSEEIAFLAGVELSYFDEESQRAILSFSEGKQMKIKLDFIKELRKFSSEVDEDVLNSFCGLSQPVQEQKVVPAYDESTNEDKKESNETEPINEDEVLTVKALEHPKETKTAAKNEPTEDEYFDANPIDDFADDYSGSELEMPTQKEIQESVKLTMDMLKKSPAEINQMCDSGMFSSIIQGYILLACDEAGTDLDINLSNLFDMYSAQDARNRYIK